MWINEVTNPKPVTVSSVKLTPKGLIFESPSYDAFIFRSHKLYAQIIAALNKSVAEGLQMKGIKLEPSDTEKCGFIIKASATKVQWHPYSRNDAGFINHFGTTPASLEDASNMFE
jgi:hypothetical protein